MKRYLTSKALTTCTLMYKELVHLCAFMQQGEVYKRLKFRIVSFILCSTFPWVSLGDNSPFLHMMYWWSRRWADRCREETRRWSDPFTCCSLALNGGSHPFLPFWPVGAAGIEYEGETNELLKSGQNIGLSQYWVWYSGYSFDWIIRMTVTL